METVWVGVSKCKRVSHRVHPRHKLPITPPHPFRPLLTTHPTIKRTFTVQHTPTTIPTSFCDGFCLDTFAIGCIRGNRWGTQHGNTRLVQPWDERRWARRVPFHGRGTARRRICVGRGVGRRGAKRVFVWGMAAGRSVARVTGEGGGGVGGVGAVQVGGWGVMGVFVVVGVVVGGGGGGGGHWVVVVRQVMGRVETGGWRRGWWGGGEKERLLELKRVCVGRHSMGLFSLVCVR